MVRSPWSPAVHPLPTSLPGIRLPITLVHAGAASCILVHVLATDVEEVAENIPWTFLYRSSSGTPRLPGQSPRSLSNCFLFPESAICAIWRLV